MSRFVLRTVITFLLLAGVIVFSFSCVCSPSECEEISEEDCPAGGGTVWDPCKCCRICARTEGEPCGGPHGFHGTCAKGLDCVVSSHASGKPVLAANSEGICTSASTAEDLLSRAFYLANRDTQSHQKTWKDRWKIFLSSKISFALLSWDASVIAHARNRCKKLKQIQVIHVKKFDAGLVLNCPETVVTLDFDGELVNRSKTTLREILSEGNHGSWLCDSEKILRSILVSIAKIPAYTPSPGHSALSELHLGNVPIKIEDLGKIIAKCQNLHLLKHYQLVSALYKLHSDPWRKKQALPVYKLRNLDVDFSHVARCRMSPEWVLAPDALYLAVKLCPHAKIIRVRFDCSTPNDVLVPLLTLESIKEFSAVCVTSGERSLIDFSDMTPILEKNGPNDLTYLELKVIEEVEIHKVIENCPKLDTIILSGCGYVTPVTCSSFNCKSYRNGSMKKLRLLFYADGDDFSWDHGVPECFWKATLLPPGANQVVRLRGIFMEYPRIPRDLTSSIFSPGNGRLPFPEVVAVSFCRFDEITVEDVASICGLPNGNSSSAVPCDSLKYVRLSNCEKIDDVEEKRLRKWVKNTRLTDLVVHVDK